MKDPFNIVPVCPVILPYWEASVEVMVFIMTSLYLGENTGWEEHSCG